MMCAKWLQTATSTTKLTHPIRIRLARSFRSLKMRLASLGAESLYAIVTAHSRAITALDVFPEVDNNVFCTVGEDSVMSVWSHPDFRSSDKADNEISMLCSDIVVDQMLTGCQFINCDHNNNICASAYDGDQLEIWKHNEHAEKASSSPTKGMGKEKEKEKEEAKS